MEYEPKTDYGPLYYNVNTELHNYTPIAFDDILADFQQRKEEYEQFGMGPKVTEALAEAQKELLEL
jgi:hypothetical protein